MPLMLTRTAFLLMLIAALVLHGGTQPPAQLWLENALIILGIAYAAARLISARSLPVSSVVPWMAAALLLLGWLAALNPHSVFDRNLRLFLPITPAPWWPWGTVDGATSVDTMRRITGMLGALLMAWDMGMAAGWRRALLIIIMGCGLAEAGFGLAHKVENGDVFNYWDTAGTKRFRDTAFGFFWYHGNAGAFMNLCWPFVAVAAWQEFRRREAVSSAGQLRRAFLVLASMMLVGAVWLNQSRAAQGIFLLQLVLLIPMLMILQRRQGDELGQTKTRTKLVWVAAAIVMIAVLMAAFGADRNLAKWDRIWEGGLATDGRWVVLHTCAHWFGEVPMLGYGPGTFAPVFIVKTTGMADAPRGYWQFAHNDYLQTLLEWGWLGLGLWLALGGMVLAALVRGTLQAMRGRTVSAAVQATLAALVVSVVSVVVHAAVDFPLQILSIQLHAATLCGVALAMMRTLRVEPGEGLAGKGRRRHTGGRLGDHAGAP